MIPILTAQQTREADAYTIAQEPISSLSLMERASQECVDFILNNFGNQRPLLVLCGMGNNGGDGLAISRMLLQVGCQVRVGIVRYSKKSSSDFDTNLERLLVSGKVMEILTEEDFPGIAQNEIVVDALFGTGLSHAPEGLAAAVIRHVNRHSAYTIAIDLPSGLLADTSSVEHKESIINANITLSFQVPKLAFFFPENAKHVGAFHILNIGLHPAFMAKCITRFHVTELRDLARMMPPRKAFSHKGTYGHALIMAGSDGKTGAAVLAAKACLRAGVGLLTVQVPRSSRQVLQTSVPEAMLAPEEGEIQLETVADAGKYDAIGIGPGIGTHEETARVLKLLLQGYNKPIVFDADALNILAENKTWLSFLPENSILTPHPKEFERLFGKTANDFDRLELLSASAMKYKVCMVLKGNYTLVASPGGNVFINTTGNPGMATGGTGDVLTGILTGLLAQGLGPLDACMVGVGIHGLAGDLALEQQSEQSLIATDLVDHLGKAFKKVAEFRQDV